MTYRRALRTLAAPALTLTLLALPAIAVAGGPATAGGPDAAPVAPAAPRPLPLPEPAVVDLTGDSAAHAHDHARPSAAAGSRPRVRRWPGGRVPYVDRSKDPRAVKAAVRAWNRSGVKVRFVEVKKARKARLVIRNSRNVPSGCGSGLASVGYTPGRKAFVNILHGGPEAGQMCSEPAQTLVVAHELGHVIGLGHRAKGCSLMNTSVTGGVSPTGCYDDPSRPQGTIGHWRCRILEPVDLKAARKLYGAKRKPRAKDPAWCDLAPLPTSGPVSYREAAASPDGRAALLVFHQPEPALPDYLASEAVPPWREIVHVAGGCASGAAPTVLVRGPWPVGPGETETFTSLIDAPGVDCYQVRALDGLLRFSPAPAQVEALGRQ